MSKRADQERRRAAKNPGIATRKPETACQPFMSTPRTRTEVAESPMWKSGFAIRPGTLQTRTAIEPRMAAHWTGWSGRSGGSKLLSGNLAKMEAMATGPKKRLPAAERRELILTAAGRLFGKRGYSRVTLDEIAAAAGVTKPMLYRHFDSKKALYLALLERHRDDLPRFFEGVPRDLPFNERIEANLETWFD